VPQVPRNLIATRVTCTRDPAGPPTRSTPPTHSHITTSTLSDASMTDLSIVLPGFPTQSYARLIPSLEKNLICTTDLITLDASEIAKRAQLPLVDVKRLCHDVLLSLQGSLGVAEAAGGADRTKTPGLLRKTGKEVVEAWDTVSTLDDTIDSALGGGIPTGYITEVTGER
jgi:DNA repair protein RAD57